MASYNVWPDLDLDADGDAVQCSTSEAARLLGMTEQTVQKWIHAGLLTARPDRGEWIVLLPLELLPERDASRVQHRKPVRTGDSPYDTLQLELPAPDAHTHATPTELDRVIKEIRAQYVAELQLISADLARHYSTQAAEKDAQMEVLRRRAEAANRDRAALEERIRVLQRQPRTRFVQLAHQDELTASRREWQVWVIQAAVALLLGLAILGMADYFIRGDDIPLLPEPAGATAAPTTNQLPMVVPATNSVISIGGVAAVATVTTIPTQAPAASNRHLAPPSATLSSRSATSAQPTASATIAPTTIPTPDSRSLAAVLQRVVAAEAAFRMGQIDTSLDYGTGASSSLRVRFNLGDKQHAPQFHATSVYSSTAGNQVVERITIGEQSWERTAGAAWVAKPAQESVLGEIQSLLPHAASISNAQINPDSSADVLRWYDGNRDADMTLTVDSSKGFPRMLRQVTRSTRSVLTVTYSAWNEPIEIKSPV